MTKDLRFLVDVGVGTQVEQYLKSMGCDVSAIRDIDNKMEDQAILALAVAEQRIVVTMDKDFGELHFLLGLPHCGVLLLRLDDADSAEKSTPSTPLSHIIPMNCLGASASSKMAICAYVSQE